MFLPSAVTGVLGAQFGVLKPPQRATVCVEGKPRPRPHVFLFLLFHVKLLLPQKSSSALCCSLTSAQKSALTFCPLRMQPFLKTFWDSAQVSRMKR